MDERAKARAGPSRRKFTPDRGPPHFRDIGFAFE